MVLGHGAPVNPNSIYVPFPPNVTSGAAFLLNAIAVPSALRAAGSVQSTDLSWYDNKVQIDSPVTLNGRPDIGEGEYVSQYGYRYDVAAKDFGLQRYTGLVLHVEGLCTTEYGWHSNSSSTDGKESYCLWGNCSLPITIPVYDSPIPVAVFKTDLASTINNPAHLNHSFAMIVSSAGHTSYFEGKDPFYLTGPKYTEIRSNKVYRVKKGRPILSCWQSDAWRYRNQQFAVKGLSSIITDFPEALGNVLISHLSEPMMTKLGLQLGQSALFSARSSLGINFYAAGASVHADLTHLILASYIATKNILTDTALVRGDNATDTGIPSLLDDEQLKDMAIFVIYSKDISALSLAVLIAVPIVVAVMFLIAYIVTSHPWFPWYVVQGYQATALYNLLDEKLSGAEQPSSDDTKKEQSHGHHSWRHNTIARFEGPRASGRQASIVQGADGQPTLIVTERAERPEPRQTPGER
ncbi:uncharacterized protein N0V89_005840 [Didymosphaeria variabile]|uniref:Uncharacterized protein n=1 Tax=Didymosphaeria variabile TaxID=1932322 RepID=A0A9W8XP97_9PLEO|nr:uncharacterized protein N0V89_005840 [Didymosphaeria variabile]KAJ4354107.1 hypothetical protein N0V89_005840 [Didymosphaeria variabile]